MSDTRRILLVGLTGGIASGKTTVARILAEHGAFIVDADELAHQVMEPDGPAFPRIVERFGREILDANGRIHRAKLAGEVFRVARSRAALNAIVHPLVRAEFRRRVAGYVPEGHAPIAIFDAALLVETGAYVDFDRLVVTRCSCDAQIRRLVARSGLPAAEAVTRIEAQAPLERKLDVADYVIDTDGTLRETRRQTDQVYARLVADHEREIDR